MTKTLIEMNSLSNGLWLIHRWHYSIKSVVREYEGAAVFTDKVTGYLYLLQ